MKKYVAIGHGWNNALTHIDGDSKGEALHNFVKNHGHDPWYILTTAELNKGKTRIQEAVRELKSKGLI